MTLGVENKLLRKLERFEIAHRGVYGGRQIGHRRSATRGSGLEFADHKEYSIGDDLRYLDWNVYGRLEELFIKTFEQEESLPTYVLVDRSASMLLGQPSKFTYASQIAASLAYVALFNHDNVRVGMFGDGLLSSTKVVLGKTRIYEVLEFLDTAPEGETDITRALQSFSNENRIPGVLFVISDFLDPKGAMEGIRLLASRKFAVYGLHLVAPEEGSPQASGDIEIRDIENDRSLRIPLRRDTIERFGAFFKAHCDTLRSELRRYGARYLQVSTAHALEDVLFSAFPKEGIFV